MEKMLKWTVVAVLSGLTLHAEAAEYYMGADQCATLKAALRNRVEAIFRVEIHHKTATTEPSDREEKKQQFSYAGALAHFDNGLSKRAADILTSRCSE